MKELHIITPVKDSIETTIETIESVMGSKLEWKHSYTIYNDYSTPENTQRLAELAQEKGFELVNLSDLTSHPSPNYRTVLQHAQQRALAADAGLVLIESDVVVAPDTLQKLADSYHDRPKAGILAAVTVDREGHINYPYLYAQGKENQVIETKKSCSFCCTMLTPALLKAFNFETLDPNKHWFDVTISHESRKLGFINYLFATLPVVHSPHSSRPWKLLKYTNPFKYYWNKYVHGFDKI